MLSFDLMRTKHIVLGKVPISAFLSYFYSCTEKNLNEQGCLSNVVTAPHGEC